MDKEKPGNTTIWAYWYYLVKANLDAVGMFVSLFLLVVAINSEGEMSLEVTKFFLAASFIVAIATFFAVLKTKA